MDNLKALRLIQLHFMDFGMELKYPSDDITLDVDYVRKSLHKIPTIISKGSTPISWGFVTHVQEAMCLGNFDSIPLPFQLVINGVKHINMQNLFFTQLNNEPQGSSVNFVANPIPLSLHVCMYVCTYIIHFRIHSTLCFFMKGWDQCYDYPWHPCKLSL